MTDFIDIDQPAEDFISHHGVKGQKWGVRKDRSTSGRRSKTKRSLITININKGSASKKQEVSKKAGILKKTVEAKKKSKSKSESIHDLSDEELNARISRLQREQQYKQLLQQSASSIQPSNQSKSYVNQFKDQMVTSLISGVAGGAGEFARAAVKYKLSSYAGMSSSKDKNRD